ncbi:MAG: M48 family metalloprotease [Thermodesulfobacteriota bacterium]
MGSSEGTITRRTVLQWAAFTFAVPVWWSFSGCATNPVTGESELMLVSQEQEIRLDREKSPHQISADYGRVQNQDVQRYLDDVGQEVSARTHRPDMPYRFTGVNAVYANAYAFPGGTIATTRGMLLELDNEAELAALLAHEVGHVNARHTAARMSTGMFVQGLLGGAGALVSSAGNEASAEALMQLGGFGAGALLAKYSRDDERQADALGMEYMVRAGYNPRGMVGLMDILRGMSERKPNVIEQMFSSHPMSEDRYRTATQRLQAKYSESRDLKVGRERYLDNVAPIRTMQGPIEAMQEGQKSLGAQKAEQARAAFKKALASAPDDYAALVMMGQCQLKMESPREAQRYFQAARDVLPQEPQAAHFLGLALIALEKYDSAYEQFLWYEEQLPGNPNTLFLQGLALEGAQRRQSAAEAYVRFLQTGAEGEQAQYAQKRLQEWGYL